MQTLAQTQKMDQLEQEVHELREEVTTLRVEVEKLTNLVSSLIVQQKPQPLGVRPPQRQHQPLRIQLPRQQAPQQLDTWNHAPGMLPKAARKEVDTNQGASSSARKIASRV